MEDPVLKNTSTDIQNENVNPSVDREGLFNSAAVLPVKEISSGTNGNLEILIENKSNEELNGYNTISCDSLQMSELANKKTCSPTLIESAIKVMKNLFSPEKVKSNISQSNCSKSASVSPVVSTGIIGKADAFASEIEYEMRNTVHITPGENSFKTTSQNSELDMLQTPIILDPHNNTDESFMTTVSLIDDSFHSAVANFDEQGELIRNGANVKDNFFNSSQSDTVDPSNATLENNDSCLENTMLNVDNFLSDGIQFANLSVQNKDHFIKNFSSTQTDGRNSCVDDPEKVSVIQVQYDKCPIQSEKDSEIEASGISSEITSEAEAARDLGYQGNFEKTSRLSGMADIYLNKFFVKQTPSEQCKIFSNGFDKNTSTEVLGNPETESDKPSEIHLKSSNNEDSCVNSSISTTTIVLETGESVDLENRLIALKADDSGTNFSMSTFEDDNSDYWLRKDISQFNAQGGTRENPRNFSRFRKNQRSCVSEGNSPNTSGSILSKLNKSDEFLNQRMFSEVFEKNIRTEKSPLDFPLMKFSEASKLSKDSDNGKSPENFKETNNSKNDENSMGSPSNKKNTVPVISQQSYTILNVHNKSLNRPVIEPININLSKRAMQKNNDKKLSPDLKIVEKSGNNSDDSFDSEHLVKSSQLKQSTPLCEENKNSDQKFFSTTSLRFNSPEMPESVCDETKIIEDSNLLGEKGKQIFSANESKDGFSTAKSYGDTDVGSAPSKNNQTIKKFKEHNKINKSPQLEKSKASSENTGETVPQNLNQTFDKKQSPLNSKKNEKSESRSKGLLNQTFEKRLKSPRLKNGCPKEKSPSPEQGKLNTTFDINMRSPNKTFTKETKSPEINESNLTFIKLESPEPSLMNKTYDKFLNSQLNQTFSKKTESPRSQNLNETFDKKPESSVLGIQVSDKILESGNKLNQTFAMDGKKAIEEQHQTVDIKESEMESASKVGDTSSEGNKSFEKVTEIFKKFIPSESQFHSSSSLTVPLSLDYRTSSNSEGAINSDVNGSSFSTKSSNTSLFCSDLSTVIFNEEDEGNQSIDELSGKLGKMDLNDNNKQDFELNLSATLETEDNLLTSLKDDKLRCDPDLVELIREQFSTNDIEKICSVVQDLSSVKLTDEILKASEQFDKSFHGNASESEFKVPEVATNKEKALNTLSPKSFDFLNSIGGKPTGRDLSRESLYVKFDPLVQPSANSLIDFTKEGEVLAEIDTSPGSPHSSSICEQLLTISPQKKPDAIVPPLTPLSHKTKADSNEDKLERLKALQNEIYFLRNLYAERERSNKTKMEEYENQIAKLTGESCMLEDKLKESNDREKSLVKKMKEQTQNIGHLKVIMEEYVKAISKLSSELERIKSENTKQLETLSVEKDSYMTHLQNTEAAFTDVHTKYEKSKKTIVGLKANETTYRNTITKQAEKIEEFKLKAKEAQEKALVEFQKVQEELNQTKANHSQEVARLKAQLRKTELKLEALQESLDQKIKENQQLTAICDELIEGKK